MSIFSDVSVNAQDISTDAFDAVDAILSDDSADSSSDESAESADSSSDESSESADSSSNESSESTDSSSDESSESAESSSDESAESADSSSNESAENAESSNDESLENTDESADNTEDNASDSAEDKDSTEDNADVDKTEDNNSSSSSSSSSEEPEEATTEAETEAEESTEETTEAVEESTEESTEETTEAEESTEAITEAAENDQNSEENTEETTEAEESTETTTVVVEEPSEATGEDLLGGAIDEKDEARDIAISSEITVYSGHIADALTTNPTTVTAAVKIPEAEVDTIVAAIGSNNNYKVKWIAQEDDNKNFEKVEVGASAGEDGSNYKTSGVTVKVKDNNNDEYTFIAKVVDTSDPSNEEVIKDDLSKIKVKVIASNVSSSTAGDDTTPNDIVSAGASDYVSLQYKEISSSPAVSALKIKVDKGIKENAATGAGKVKWEVFNKNASGALSDDASLATVLKIGADSSNLGTTAIDSDNIDDDSINTIYLQPTSVGTAYLRATVNGIVVYQARVDVKGVASQIVAVNKSAYIGGKTNVEFTSTAAKDGAKISWELTGTDVNLGSVTAATEKEPSGGSYEDLTEPAATGDPYTFAPTTGGINNNTCSLWLDLSADGVMASGTTSGTINIKAKLNGIDIYEANLALTAKPTFQESTGADGTAKKIEDKELKINESAEIKINDASIKGDLSWEMGTDLNTTPANDVKVINILGDSDATNLFLGDSANPTSGVTVAKDTDKTVYVKAPDTAKISTYYVQAKSGDTVVYIAKVSILPAKVAGDAAGASIEELQKGEEKEIEFELSGVEADSAGDKSLEWKLASYDGSTLEAANVTTQYFQFSKGSATQVSMKQAIEKNAKNEIINPKVTIKAVGVPTGKKVYLEAYAKGVLVYKSELKCYDIASDITANDEAVTKENKELNVADTTFPLTLTKTFNTDKYNGKTVKWKIYKDAAHKQPADNVDVDNKSLCIQLTETTEADEAKKVAASSEIENKAAKVYVYSTGNVGVAYVVGTVGGVTVYEGEISVSQEAVTEIEKPMYEKDKMTLEVDKLAKVEGEVTWGIFTDNTGTTAASGDRVAFLDDDGNVDSSNVTKNTKVDANSGKTSVKISTTRADADTAFSADVTNYVIAKYNGAVVYRAKVVVSKAPTVKATGLAASEISIKEGETTVPEAVFDLSSDDQTKTVNVTGLGLSSGDIKWLVYKGTNDGTTTTYGNKNDESIVQIGAGATESDNTTSITNQKTTLNLKIPAKAMGYAQVVGVSALNESTVICRFNVKIAPSNAAAESKALNIYSVTGTARTHELTATLNDKVTFEGKDINWSVENASGSAAIDDTKTSTSEVPNSGELTVYVTETGANAAFDVIAKTTDGVQIFKFTVTPKAYSYTPPTAGSNVGNISIDAKTALKVTANNITGTYNDNNVVWKVLDKDGNAFTEANATNSPVMISPKIKIGNQPSDAKVTQSIGIDTLTGGNSSMYIYQNGKAGKVFVVAEVDGLEVFRQEVNVGKITDPVETKTIYAGLEETITVELDDAFEENADIVWSQSKPAASAGGSPTAGELVLETSAKGDPATVKVKKDTDTDGTVKRTYAEIKVKADSNTTADVVGKINDVEVYKLKINAEAFPTAALKIDNNTATATDNIYPLTKTLDNSDMSEILVSNLGSAVGKSIDWQIYKADGSGTTDTSVIALGKSAAEASNKTSPLSSTATEINSSNSKLYVKTVGVGSVLIKGKISGKDLCTIKVTVNPSKNDVKAVEKKIFTESGKTFKLSSVIDTTGNLIVAAGQTINWVVNTDGSKNDAAAANAPATVVTNDSSSTLTQLGDSSKNQEVYVSITTNAQTASATSGFYVSAYWGDVKVAQFKVMPVTAPSGNDAAKTQDIDITASTPFYKIETPDLAGFTEYDCQWQLYNDDSTPAPVDIDHSLVILGKLNAAGDALDELGEGEDGVSKVVEGGSWGGNKSTVYIKPNPYNKAVGTNKLVATICGVTVYTATINCNIGVDASSIQTDNIEIYGGEYYEFEPNFNFRFPDEVVTWKQVKKGDETTADSTHQVNGLSGTSAEEFNTKTDENNKTRFTITASGTANDESTFIASVKGTDVYKVNVKSIAPAASNTLKFDGEALTAGEGSGNPYVTIGANASSADFTLSGLTPSVSDTIEWTIKSKDGADFGANKGYIKLVDASGNDVTTTTMTTAKDTDGNDVTSTVLKLQAPKLGVSELVGKVGNTEVAKFNIIVKPNDNTLAETAEVYKNTSKATLTIQGSKLSSIATFLDNGTKIDWEVDSKITKGDTTTASITKDASGNIGDINFVIDALTSSAAADDELTVTAFVGDKADKLELCKFTITVKENPTATTETIGEDAIVSVAETGEEKNFGLKKGSTEGTYTAKTLNVKVGDIEISDNGSIKWKVTDSTYGVDSTDADPSVQVITDTTALAGDETNVKIKCLKPGKAYILGYIESGSTKIPVKNLNLTVYNAPSEAINKTIVLNDKNTKLHVTTDSVGTQLTSSDNINWFSGTYKEVDGKKVEEYNTNVVAIDKTGSSRGLSTLTQPANATVDSVAASQITVKTKNVGNNGFIKATDAAGHEVGRWNITIIDEITSAKETVNTKVGEEQSYKFEKLPDIAEASDYTLKVYEKTAYDSAISGNTEPTVATDNGIEFKFNTVDGDGKPTTTTTTSQNSATIGKAVTSFSYKATDAAVNGYTGNSYYIIAEMNENEIAKIEVNVKVEELASSDTQKLSIPKGKEHTIEFSVGKITGITATSNITWEIGEVKNKKETKKASVISLSSAGGTFTDVLNTGTAADTAQLAAGTITPSEDGKDKTCKAVIKVNEAVKDGEAGVYYIKGIISGTEIYKAYITPTEEETVSSIKTIDKFAVKSTETINATVGNELVIGELTGKLESDGTIDPTKFTEGKESKDVLYFAKNKRSKITVEAPEEDASATSANVDITSLKEGTVYIKEIHRDETNGDTVINKWYINVAKPAVSDVKISKSQLKGSKNGLVKAEDADKDATADETYLLTLYKSKEDIGDNNLINKSLSQFIISPEVYDSENKLVKATDAVGDKELLYDCDENYVKIKKNADGSYTISADSKGTDTLYFTTAQSKATTAAGDIVDENTADADLIPTKKIAIKIDVKEIAKPSEVTERVNPTGSNTSVTLTDTAKSIKNKVISVGDTLKVSFDGSTLDVVKYNSKGVAENATEATTETTTAAAGKAAAASNSMPKDGRWLLFANDFSDNVSSNNKTSSAAKLVDKGEDGVIYVENVKAKGSESNVAYLRYVNKFDSNIVYAQVPIVITPSKASKIEVSASKGFSNSKLQISMGDKATLKVKTTGGSNKNIKYSFVEPVDGDADDANILPKGYEYIQINSKGIITPLKPTGVDENDKPMYVKVLVESTESDNVEDYVLVEVLPNVKSIVLNRTSLSVANNQVQNVVLRLNPTYPGFTGKVKVTVPDAPFKLYEDDECNDEIANNAEIDIENGIKNIYVKMEGNGDLTKANSTITFEYCTKKKDENTFEVDPKVKAAKLTIKRSAAESNVNSVNKSLSESFTAAVGVPIDLKTVVNPSTAINIIDWDIKVKTGTDSNGDATYGDPTDGDYVITNGWFIPVKNKDFKLSGETVGWGADGEELDVTYYVDVYKPISSLDVTGNNVKADDSLDNTTSYVIYNGYLRDENDENKSLNIKGGQKIKLSITDSGATIDEPINWSTNSPVGLSIIESNNNGAELLISPNKKGLYTLTGVTQYSKQKFSFKVNVEENLAEDKFDTDGFNDFIDPDDMPVEFSILEKGENTTVPLEEESENELSKGKTAQIIIKSTDVAFANIAFSSSNTKYLTVNSSGVITPKLETPEGESVNVTVKMSGKVETSTNEEKDVTIEKTYEFTIGHADIAVTNKGNYIKGDYMLLNKNYSFSAKISGISSKAISTKWYIAKVAVGATPAANDFSEIEAGETINGAKCNGIKANTITLMFNDDTASHDYYIYPEICDTEGETLLDLTDGAITDYAKKFTVVGNAVKTVYLSKKSIVTTASESGNTSYLYVSAFSADGKPVTSDGIKWTSSNQYVARVTQSDNIIGDGTDASPFYYGVKIATGNTTGTATVSGIMNNSGKKVSVKVAVKPEADAVTDIDTIKINNNAALTLKKGTNGVAIKQVATTFIKDNKSVVPTAEISEEVWTVTPLGSDKKPDEDSPAYTVTLSRDTDKIKAVYDGVTAANAPIQIDAAGNLIASGDTNGLFRLQKKVKLEGGDYIEMDKETPAEGDPTSIIVTVK